MAIFVLASSATAALGRSMTEGLESALANRYVTLSLVFWIALLTAMDHPPLRPELAAAIALSAAAG